MNELQPIVIRGGGLLAHHFWGKYLASLAIDFGYEADAIRAQKILGPSWKVKGHGVIASQLEGNELEAAEAAVIRYGADPRKVASLARSCDYGEPWEVEIPIPDVESLPLPF